MNVRHHKGALRLVRDGLVAVDAHDVAVTQPPSPVSLLGKESAQGGIRRVRRLMNLMATRRMTPLGRASSASHITQPSLTYFLQEAESSDVMSCFQASFTRPAPHRDGAA